MSNIKELIPVKYKKKFLTPTTRGRAFYLVSKNKAIWFKDKRGTTCIRMKVKPSGDVINGSTLGVDPGTFYDGYTVSNSNGQFNAEFIYTDKVDNRNFIKKKSASRLMNRRSRRLRLRHRKARFSNRIGNKETNTSVYYRQHRQNQINYLKTLFNFSDVVIEDVSFNHYDDHSRIGKYFSPIEVGKNKLYSFIRQIGLEIILAKGYDTYTSRKTYFGQDLKSKDKSANLFEAHCIDSFILTRFNNDYILKNKITHFWHRKKMINRRQLIKFKNKVGFKKEYFRYGKLGTKTAIRHHSKLKKIRIKTSKSNHGPWTYMYTKVVATFRKFRPRYGGTIVTGQSRYSKSMQGKSKYWTSYGYEYYLHT